jgi:hypothetical protein
MQIYTVEPYHSAAQDVLRRSNSEFIRVTQANFGNLSSSRDGVDVLVASCSSWIPASARRSAKRLALLAFASARKQVLICLSCKRAHLCALNLSLLQTWPQYLGPDAYASAAVRAAAQQGRKADGRQLDQDVLDHQTQLLVQP